MYSRNSLAFILALICSSSGIFISILGEIISLPESGKDAIHFFDIAKNLSDAGLFVSPAFYEKLGSFEISKWFALVLYVFGDSTLSIALVGQFLRTILCLIVFFWGEARIGTTKAFIVSFLFAVSPTSLLYASLPLREIYIVIFGTLALLILLDHEKLNSRRLIIGFALLCLSAVLHPIYLFAYLLYFTLIYGIRNLFFRPRLIYWMLFTLVCYSTFGAQLSIPKIGVIDNNMFDLVLQRIQDYQNDGFRASSHIPGFLLIDNFQDLIFKSFLRCLFFIAGPFNFTNGTAIISSLYGVLFIALFSFCLIKNISSSWLLFVFICALVLALASVADGALVRHRFKIEALMFLLWIDTLHKGGANIK